MFYAQIRCSNVVFLTSQCYYFSFNLSILSGVSLCRVRSVPGSLSFRSSSCLAGPLGFRNVCSVQLGKISS